MVQEIILRKLIGQLGPAGRIIWDALRENQRLQAENEELRAENRRLEATVEARRTMKRRSPAHWRFRVRRWEMREMTFKPKEFPEGKTMEALRVHIHLDDPSEGAPYWDITSKRVIGMLLPILPHIAGTNTYVEITKHGDGPTSHFSMSVHPA